MTCACDRCLRRTWLLARLGAHLDLVRGRLDELLLLSDEDLISAVGGRQQPAVRREHHGFDPRRARASAQERNLALLCRCDRSYPVRLSALESSPAVLHIAGARFLEMIADQPVAIVGARRGSAYGTGIAHSLGRDLGCAGITVLSGMALGIDCAAHAGALSVGGPTVAVLAGGADNPYPPAKRGLYGQILASGAAISELPPGTAVRRWSFPARNRIIAALAAMTIVVEAREGSGALLTANYARRLGRPVGAVPGRVTSPLSFGPNRLLAEGATVVGGPQDVLDQLFGKGARSPRARPEPRLAPELGALLDAIAEGHDTTGALERVGFPVGQALAALASLELSGYVRREPGGRFTVTP